MNETKNDNAWNKIFAQYDIIEEVQDNGQYIISAKDIKEFREPRLMVKFDQITSKPKKFKENHLSILPISRREYIISNFDSHHKLESKIHNTMNVEFPNCVESIDINNIYSESIALNSASAIGIISDFFDVNKNELIATVNGKKGSGKFDFKVDRKTGDELNVKVSNSQIEVDGAWESWDFLSLFEAKLDFMDDFIIRQLYYPFRTFEQIVNKEIRNVFFIYSNNQFSLYEYFFDDKFDYNSIKLTKQSHYSLYDGEVELEDVTGVYESINMVSEPKTPFPQANSFGRVISLCEHLKSEKLNKQQIAEKYSFDERQSDYYTNAGIYLDLIKKENINRVAFFSLTETGEKIFNLFYKEKQLELVKCILKHEVFYKVFKEYVKTGEMPSKHVIVDYMYKSNLYNIESPDTFERRSSTISGWIKWILNLTESEI
ncbi:MAG: hypothetical protein FWE58_03140 [Methanobrevibacter sp.]|nr:hypothetical protein [Methanobrevibacter sp.]